MRAVDVDTIQQMHVEVDIEVEGAPKRWIRVTAPVCAMVFGVAGLADQMRGNGAIDNAQHLAHDGGLTGKQQAG